MVSRVPLPHGIDDALLNRLVSKAQSTFWVATTCTSTHAFGTTGALTITPVPAGHDASHRSVGESVIAQISLSFSGGF